MTVAQGRRDVIAALSGGRHGVALQLLEDQLEPLPRDQGLSTLQRIALTQAGRTDEALAAL